MGCGTSFPGLESDLAGKEQHNRFNIVDRNQDPIKEEEEEEDKKKKKKKNKDKQMILTQPKKEVNEKYIKGKVYKKEEIKENIISSEDKDTFICLIKKNIYYYDYNDQLKISTLYYLIFPRGYSFLNLLLIYPKHYLTFLNQLFFYA